MSGITGIHHVSAIASDQQSNIRFYTKMLGLRLVKVTVNFDDTSQYHLYYGNAVGEPGTLLTFFIFGPDGRPGRRGSGQVDGVAFSIPQESCDDWIVHLSKNDIAFEGPEKRFSDDVITLYDPDGLKIELVASDDARGPWGDGPLDNQMAIRGLHSATLSLKDLKRSSELYEDKLDFQQLQKSGNRTRYVLCDEKPGNLLDIVVESDRLSGSGGVGTVHHIAFRVSDDRAHLDLRRPLMRGGYRVTPVLDRHYFNAMYFREPNTILFEIATDPPGFLVDQSEAGLGEGLSLPPWLEKERSEIEAKLAPLQFNP